MRPVTWLRRRSLGFAIALMTVLPVIIATAAVAGRAISGSRQYRATVASAASPAIRDELVARMKGNSARSARSDASMAGALVVMAGFWALWATRSLRRRVLELRDVAERLAQVKTGVRGEIMTRSDNVLGPHHDRSIGHAASPSPPTTCATACTFDSRSAAA